MWAYTVHMNSNVAFHAATDELLNNTAHENSRKLLVPTQEKHNVMRHSRDTSGKLKTTRWKVYQRQETRAAWWRWKGENTKWKIVERTERRREEIQDGTAKISRSGQGRRRADDAWWDVTYAGFLWDMSEPLCKVLWDSKRREKKGINLSLASRITDTEQKTKCCLAQRHVNCGVEV